MENQEIESLSEEIEDSYSNDDIYNITSWGAAVRDLWGLATDQIAQTALSSRLQVIY